MSLNRWQRGVLLTGAALVALAILFPPMHYTTPTAGHFDHFLGSLIVSRPEDHLERYSVNTALLSLELAGIALGVSFAVLALTSRKPPPA
jgi:hypothetical protein